MDTSIEKLKDLAKNDAILHAAINILPEVMKENQEFTSIKTLVERANIPRGEAVRIAKQFQDLGLGKLRLGRRGKPTRFEWTQPGGEVKPRVQPKTEHPTKVATVATPAKSDIDLVQLKSGREILLPSNLSTDDIWELVRYCAARAA